MHILLAIALSTCMLLYEGLSAAEQVKTTVPQLPVLNWEQRSDWISVKDQGALGDGKTDDSAAIQKAFDQISRGVTIYFPAGTYNVTQTLFIRSPDKRALYGITIIGHGRDTKIVWDGKAGNNMIESEGKGYSRIVGIDFDGKGKAAIGDYHFAQYTFETVLRYQHVAFRNFVMAGVYAEPTKDAFAMAETSFENCLFENCGVGVSFTQFNDYDITFDGCEFRRCGTGIRCWFGNFYVRNSHFEESRDIDIESVPEHGCTVRRCTSLNSNKFIHHQNAVATLAIQNCSISGWKDPDGAISVSGAPVMIFDCAFTDPPPAGKSAIRVDSHWQRLISSQNTVTEGFLLFNEETGKRANVKIYDIPAGKINRTELSSSRQFLKSEVIIPGKVFDAKRDFGALGNGTADDTAAIQKTIDTARENGNGAIAYLPAGRYVVKETLKVKGKDYYLGGTGMLSTHLEWRGAEDGSTILVEDPDHLVVEHLDLQKKSGIDILQTCSNSDQPSFITYDGLFVSRPNEEPFPGGIVCRGLNAKSTVVIPCMAGSMRFTDCGQATILVPISYYGSIVVEGKKKEREGFIGVMSRFSGGKQNVVIRDNHSIVMSDYYSENSGNIFLLEGSDDDPPGRITVQGAKLHLNEKLASNVLEIRNWSGQIFMGTHQFNGTPSGKISQTGDRPVELFLMGNCFYHSLLEISKDNAAKVYLLGNAAVGQKDISPENLAAMFGDSMPQEKMPDIALALDDLRRLGKLDLQLNHPDVLDKDEKQE